MRERPKFSLFQRSGDQPERGWKTWNNWQRAGLLILLAAYLGVVFYPIFSGNEALRKAMELVLNLVNVIIFSFILLRSNSIVDARQQAVMTVFYPIAAGFFLLRLLWSLEDILIGATGNLAVTLQVAIIAISIIFAYLLYRKAADNERRQLAALIQPYQQQLDASNRELEALYDEARQQKQIDIAKAEPLPGEVLKAERLKEERG